MSIRRGHGIEISLNTNSTNHEWATGQEMFILRKAEEERRGYHPTRQEKKAEEEAWREDHAKPPSTRTGCRPCLVQRVTTECVNSYTTLPFPNAAPWNKDLILSWLLMLNMKLTQIPHRNRELGQHWGKSQSPGPTPNPPRKSSQIRFTFTASLAPTMTQRIFLAPQTLFNCSLINLKLPEHLLLETKTHRGEQVRNCRQVGNKNSFTLDFIQSTNEHVRRTDSFLLW